MDRINQLKEMIRHERLTSKGCSISDMYIQQWENELKKLEALAKT